MSDKHSAIWIPKANDPCPCESGAAFGDCHGTLDDHPDLSANLAALVARGIDLGFEVVQLELDTAGPNAKLRLGYAGESQAASMLVIDGARLLEADPDRAYFGELIHKIGRLDMVDVPEAAWLAGDGDLESIARVYITLHTLAGRLPTLKARLLERMAATGRTAVDVHGLGAVVYAPATSRIELDRSAASAMIKDFGHEPPTKTTTIAASLRVTHAAHAAEG